MRGGEFIKEPYLRKDKKNEPASLRCNPGNKEPISGLNKGDALAAYPSNVGKAVSWCCPQATEEAEGEVRVHD